MLQNLQILDLADEKASFCSRLLSDMGARVIKVEPPGGSSSRKQASFINSTPGLENSLPFLFSNSGKLSITLDMGNKAGQELFFRLLEKTDAVIEAFEPGYMAEIGLGFDALIKKKPDIIMASVTGFGQTGPKSAYKACGLIAEAAGGQMHVTGSPLDQPLKSHGDQPFYTASLFAGISILLALRKKKQTGKGDHIDISLQEAVTSTLEHVMVRYFSENRISQRQGSQNWNNAFCILPCKDGFVQISLFQQWDTLSEWLASEGMAEDLLEAKWKERDFREENREHIVQVLEKWTQQHTVKELIDLSQLMRLPWAPVQKPTQVLECPHLKERGFFIDMEHSETSKMIKVPGMPFRSGTIPLNTGKYAPRVGEHNKQIYVEELGITEDELKQLAKKSII